MTEMDSFLKDNFEKEVNVLTSTFPIFPINEFDTSTNVQFGNPIGFSLDYPADLKERIIAARVSYQLQIGMDYARKQYVNKIKEDESSINEARLDKEIQTTCLQAVEESMATLGTLQGLETGTPLIGDAIGGLTILRGEFTLKCAFAQANNGALFEACALARLVMEKLAFTYKVLGESDVDIVQNTSPQSSLSALKKVHAGYGKLYGYLSAHTHWNYPAHVDALSFGERNGVLFCSAKFKLRAFVMLIALTELFVRTVNKMIAYENQLVDESYPVTEFNPDELYNKVVKVIQDEEELVGVSETMNIVYEFLSKSFEN